MPLIPFDGQLDNEVPSGKLVPFNGELDKEDSKPKAGLGTAIKTSFANVGNVADLAASTLAGSAAALFGDDEEARAIYENMEARRKAREQWANPDQQELTFGGKVAGTLATLPMQVLTGGLQPAETTRTALAAGETPSKAVQAGMIDAAGNLVGIALPGWKEGGMLVRGATGAAANVGQEFATRKAIQGVLETEQGKAAFEPTAEDLAVSGIVGGGFGVALGRKAPKASTKAQNILQQQKAKDVVTKSAELDTAMAELSPMERMAQQLGAPDRVAEAGGVRTPIRDVVNELLGIDERAARVRGEEPAPTDVTKQLELFDQPEQGRVPMQFEATPGDWRIDENGMPVRVDLSLEAQNLQNPLQRNLWGDELDVQVPRDPGAPLPMDRDIMGYPRMTEPSLFTGDLENQRPLTEAIDLMDPTVRNRTEQGRFAPGTVRGDALQRLQGELPASGELEAARVQAEGFTPTQEAPSLTQKGFIKKQGGGLKVDWSDVNKAENSLYKSEDGTYIPRNPNVQQAIADSLKTGKDIDVVQWLQSGATSVAMKTKNPVIRAAEDIVQSAGKRSDLTIRQQVLPAENAARKLNAQELIDLAEIFKDEMFTGRRIDGNILAENFSVKQLEAYTQFRDMFDKTLDAQNAVRVAQGKKPISSKEAYLSSRWEGDFRQPVYDKDGNLVWYLASNTKLGLKRQIKALEKQFPDLVIDEAKQRTIRSNQRTTDIESAYSIMLDLLGRDNPEVIRMQQFIEELQQVEGEKTLGQTKHFKNKGNVRGFVGDRPGKGGKTEAAAMLQQQIQYAKNAFKWSEMQRAAADIKEIIGNPDLNTQQPNTVKYVRDYFKNALGFGEARVFSELNNVVREMGISPNVVAKAVGDMKSLFIAQKLMLSAGYTAANMIQTSNVLPYLTDLRNQGVKGNFISAITNGIGGGLAMTASHYGRLAGMLEYGNVPMMLPFWKDAFRYAEDNGITARSIIDESPIDSSRAMRVGSYTLSAPETIVRSIAFMTYAEFLRSSGKYADMQTLFQEAERLTNKSMVDYRETERPLVFGKAGTVGNFLNTLQTFPISFYNQYAYMVKQAMDGKPAGLITMLAMQYMLAGAMGIPYVQDMERLFEYIRDNWTSDETFAKMMDSEFLSSPRLWLIEHLGASGVYGALSTETGVGFTSRVAAPNPSEMLQSPVGPVTDIAGQIGAVGKALTSPNEVNLAQAAMKTVPVGLQGLLETAPFMEGITYDTREDGTQVFRKSSDLADQQAVIARTPEEAAVRKWGLRSQREVMERDVTFRAKSAAKAAKDRAATLPDKILNAAKAGDVGKVNELTALYTKLTGQGISNTQLENQIKEAYLTDLERYRAKKTLSPMEAMRMARLQKILEENK